MRGSIARLDLAARNRLYLSRVNYFPFLSPHTFYVSSLRSLSFTQSSVSVSTSHHVLISSVFVYVDRFILRCEYNYASRLRRVIVKVCSRSRLCVLSISSFLSFSFFLASSVFFSSQLPLCTR